MMKISRELEEAYHNTNYCVLASDQEFILRVGSASEEAAKLMAESSAEGAVFVTAWNPFGKVLAEAENIKANAALKAELDVVAATVLSGYGSSPDATWREDSFFAFPMSRLMATEFCCSHSQNAVIFVRSDGFAELVFHPNGGTALM
jgi:hypothetical protein